MKENEGAHRCSSGCNYVIISSFDEILGSNPLKEDLCETMICNAEVTETLPRCDDRCSHGDSRSKSWRCIQGISSLTTISYSEVLLQEAAKLNITKENENFEEKVVDISKNTDVHYKDHEKDTKKMINKLNNPPPIIPKMEPVPEEQSGTNNTDLYHDDVFLPFSVLSFKLTFLYCADTDRVTGTILCLDRSALVEKFQDDKKICFHVCTMSDPPQRLKTKSAMSTSQHLSWSFVFGPVKKIFKQTGGNKDIRFRVYSKSSGKTSRIEGGFYVDLSKVINDPGKPVELERTAFPMVSQKGKFSVINKLCFLSNIVA